MGNKKEGRPKRKSDQALAPPAAELPERKSKRAKAEPAPQADQTKPKAAAAEKKKAAKPKADQKPKKRQSKRSKKQQEEEEQAVEEEQLPEDEDEELEDEEDHEQQEPEKSVHDVFMEEVHAREAELSKHCLIMGQVETDEDETTLEELRALTRVFVPEKVQEDFVEVWEQLDEVGEEDSEDEGEEGDGEGEEGEEGEDQDGQPDILGAIMAAILGGKMLSTKHSSQMHAIFKTHQDQIDKAIKSKSWQEAFCKWAAILMAAHREKHWYEDTDAHADAEAICKRMQQQWKKLRARSDEELGGLVAEGNKSAKEEFDEYLQAVADDMRSIDYNV